MHACIAVQRGSKAAGYLHRQNSLSAFKLANTASPPVSLSVNSLARSLLFWAPRLLVLSLVNDAPDACVKTLGENSALNTTHRSSVSVSEYAD